MDFYGLQDSLKQVSSNVGSSGPVTIEDRYTLEDQLGKGAYGVVWKGRKRTGNSDTYYAIKQINMRHAGDKGLKDVIGEVETMSLLNHPNIVRLEETFRDETSLWIVMEYLPGGELQQGLNNKSFSEQTTRVIVTQLLEALEYIHDRGIVHRDLKPANCLLSEADSTVKISDFGFAVLAGSDQCLTTYCGTVAFMAPEILLDKNYGKPVDIWALGIMTYMMFVGRFPFKGENVHELNRSMCCSREILFADDALKATPLLRDFIIGLLTEDPNRRVTAKEALKHQWIKAVLSESDSLVPGRRLSLSMKKGTHLFRSAALAVMAMHRFIYWWKYRRLVKIDSEQIPILRDMHFMLTGVFHPKSSSLNCSEMFANKPEGLELFFTMLESTKNIEKVDLSRNNIDSLSVIQSLLRVLTRHASITSVNLSYNPIPALAGRGILRLARNPSCRLRQVILDHTSITNDIIQQINSSLKDKVFTAIVSEGSSSEKERSMDKSTSETLEALPLSQLRSQQSVPSYHCSPQVSPHTNPLSSRKTRKRSTRLPPLPQAALSKKNERFMQKVD